MTTRRMLVVVGACLVLAIVGCGGGGGNGNGGNGNGGNGAVTDIGVNAALGAAKATAPQRVGSSEQTLQGLLEGTTEVPANKAALETELASWTQKVGANANDAGAQLGLSLAILAATGYNAAKSIGENIFEELDLQNVASMAFSEDLQVDGFLADALETALMKGTPRVRGGTSTAVATAGETPTVADMQKYRAAIRDYVDPCLADVIVRMGAIAATADPTTLLLSLQIDGDTVNLYAADFNCLAAALQLVRCGLLMAYAVDPDYGSYNWDTDMYLRDANQNGILTVAEYAPPAPFGAISVTEWREAGACLRNAVDRLTQAVNDRQTADANELVMKALEDVNVAELQDYLTDATAILGGQVTVTYEWEDLGGAQVDSSATGSEQIPVNFRRLWDGMTTTGFRAWLPPLYIMLNCATYDLNGTELGLWEKHCWVDQANIVTYCWAYDGQAGWNHPDLVTVPVGGPPHNVSIPALNADLTFNWDWSQVTGTIGGQSVTGQASELSISRGVELKVADLPDKTLGGVFPEPDPVIDAITSGQRHIWSLTYGSLEITS